MSNARLSLDHTQRHAGLSAASCLSSSMSMRKEASPGPKRWEVRTLLRRSARRLRRKNSNWSVVIVGRQDLLTVCRELNLEDSLEELMRELGADEHGRISYQEFLRRRLALRPEIDALRGRQGTGRRSTPEYLPTSSDNSLGAASAGKLESWEFDSGARDLSPEPHTLQKLVEAAGGSLTSGSTSNMLDLANKGHTVSVNETGPPGFLASSDCTPLNHVLFRLMKLTINKEVGNDLSKLQYQKQTRAMPDGQRDPRVEHHNKVNNNKA
uniref:(California timema) hypothetical protein n=1 Tax=Timema californicum TaxID=61474 RepID=A0A7R9JE95_TIMCA|nr:unnamed protein product [Timema californicum]